MLVTATALSLGTIHLDAQAAAADLKQDAAQALQTPYKSHPEAEQLSKNAKAGFVFGGSYGEGVMTKDGIFAGYYNSVSASWGWPQRGRGQ